MCGKWLSYLVALAYHYAHLHKYIHSCNWPTYASIFQEKRLQHFYSMRWGLSSHVTKWFAPMILKAVSLCENHSLKWCAANKEKDVGRLIIFMLVWFVWLKTRSTLIIHKWWHIYLGTRTVKVTQSPLWGMVVWGHIFSFFNLQRQLA